MCPGHRLDLFPIRELRDTCLSVQSVLSPSGLRWHEERIWCASFRSLRPVAGGDFRCVSSEIVRQQPGSKLSANARAQTERHHTRQKNTALVLYSGTNICSRSSLDERKKVCAPAAFAPKRKIGRHGGSSTLAGEPEETIAGIA